MCERARENENNRAREERLEHIHMYILQPRSTAPSASGALPMGRVCVCWASARVQRCGAAPSTAPVFSWLRVAPIMWCACLWCACGVRVPTM